MPRRHTIAFALAAALIWNGTVLSKTGPEDAASSFLAQKVGGAAGDWQLTSAASGPDPLTGEEIWLGKFFNKKTDQMMGVVTDAQGNVRGFDDLADRTEKARLALPPFDRKADSALARYVADAERGARDHDSAAIGIFVVAEAGDAIDNVYSRHPAIERIGNDPVAETKAEADQIEAELRDARAAIYTAAEDRLADRIKSVGGEIVYGSTAAPLLFVRIPTNLVRSVAEWPEVREMGLEGIWHPAMNVAGPTIQADWTYTQGYVGTGIKVAVVEYRSVHATGDLAGKVAAWYNALNNNNTPCYSTGFDHATWVAGAIAGQSATYRGVAPGAVILSAATCSTDINTNDHDVIEAADWALGQGASVLNLSLVQDTSTGMDSARKYFDSVVYEDFDNVVAATGNLADCGVGVSENVGSPGVGWNVLTVGGIDDKNSTTWADDTLWYKTPADPSNGACWNDPAGTAWNPNPDPDFNKPEVTAPAYSVRTANSLSASGTSVASPMVAGIAAQLIARSPAQLETRPYAVKALIMAGAIDGVPLPSGTYDTDHGGVGLASAKWANQALVLGGGSTGGYLTGTASSITTYTSTFSVLNNQKVQIALVWDSKTSGADNWAKVDTNATDLDLIVTLPDGSQVTSDSATNQYEFVDFGTINGTVTVKVVVYRLSAGSSPYALAWTKYITP
jgi:subtilase family protein